MKPPFVTGLGYDVHRFSEGIPLRLCGVTIPFDKGLEAHSDGDVALHALCDALLGALALGDIGKLFPPNDDKFKGVDSTLLLEEVVNRVKKEGYNIANVDITIIAEAPKILPYNPIMKQAIATILGNDVLISIKATTNEKLGFTGRKEGIAALATTLLYHTQE